MTDQNETIVALVTPSEMKIIEQLKKLVDKAKTISEISGINLTQTYKILQELASNDWVRYDKRQRRYILSKNVEFKTLETWRDFSVADKPNREKTLEPTFVQKRLPKHDPKLVEYTLAPDELEKLKKESVKHVKYFQTKDGGYIINADYHRG